MSLLLYSLAFHYFISNTIPNLHNPGDAPMKRKNLLTGVVLIALFLISCAAHQPFSLNSAPGFWSGLWHGIISPIAFIVSLFSDIRIYEFPNSGRWYDFGFLVGISIWGGGASAARGSGK